MGETNGARRPPGFPGGEPSGVLAKDTVHRRLTMQYSIHLNLITSIFKGVALYEAAVSLFAIFSTQSGTAVKLTALSMWLAGFGAIIASYNGVMLASVIVVGITNTADLVAPFFLGLMEFTIFATLVPVDSGGAGRPSAAAELDHLTWWFLAYGLLLFIAWFSLRNLRRSVEHARATEPGDVAPFLEWQSAHIRLRARISVINACVLTVGFFAFHYGPEGLRHWQPVLSLYLVVGLVQGILYQERAFAMLEAAVDSPGAGAPDAEAGDRANDAPPAAGSGPSPSASPSS